ncbi:MAG: hypothetical protein AB7O67_04225 [Vicinamibacterales bacterium]
MKILFLTRHHGYLKHYESTIRALAEDGHQVHLAADREETLGAREMVERWTRESPNITSGWTPDREGDDWFWLATRLRLAQDFLRYQDPRYDAAPQLRQRAEERMPTMVLAALRMLGYRTAPVRAAMTGALNLLERAVPVSRALTDYIRAQAPDVVLLTPLVELGSPQLDHLRAARRLGIRTALCVGSWDHLSSKSLIRIAPDEVFVWNETQREEAETLHGVPADRVVVTGAQCFDQWFDRQPSRDREAFCRRYHLDPSRPLLLWLCSSLFRGSPAESDLVERWVRAVRSSADPRIRDANILVRPHPQRIDEWRRVDLSGYGHVAVRGGNPVDDDQKADYFDAMFHASAVVGLNTSAMIEAGIVGRPVLSIVDAKYARNQEGTLHWPYLQQVGGGLLRVARSMDEHLDQLAAAVAAPPPDTRAFVQAFVRPAGLDQPATPVLVAAIEALGRRGPAAGVRPSAAAVLVRPLLYPLIWLRMLRAWWQQVRKKSRRGLKRFAQNSRREIRQFLKRLILKRVRTEQPQVVLPKSERVRNRAQNLFDSVEEVEDTKEALTRMARSGKPIIVGPWLSETGFELLYWIPFLNWAKSYGNFRDDRLTVVSRGGCSTWYRHMTPNYRDVFEFYAPDEFRARNDQRILQQGGLQKHVEIADFDQEIIDRVRQAQGLGDVEVLHPSLMYKLFRIFWRLQASVGLVQGFTVHKRVERPPLGELAAALPREYVAVKFYTNNSFPDTPQNQAFIGSYLAQLSATRDVVLLNTGVRFDDHDDFQPANRSRIHTVEHLMTPATNLDVQTRIIAGAQAFVGTYGGFSYLAPLLGVNTLAFFSDGSGFRVDHLEIAKRVFTDLNAASFLPLDLQDLDVLRVGLGVGEGVTAGGGLRAE